MATDQIISLAVGRIAELCKPEKIVLFGSHAYGNPNANSDIDLCVITEHNTARRWLQAEICMLLADLNASFDIVAVKPSEIPENPSPNNTFFYILNQGITVYDRLRN
jgi:predicted nucleotidyltransferase